MGAGPSEQGWWNRLRWSLYAPLYDPFVRRLDAGRKASITLASPQAGERVLIVGCGPGLDLPHLPPGLHLSAGDLSPEMLRRTRAKADALGADHFASLDLRPLDAHALPYDDGSFDVVLLHLLLAVVPGPRAAIAEASRVLAPGGRVGVFDKFLGDEAAPSLARRAVNLVAKPLATDLNRRLGPLAEHAGLRTTHREPVAFGGLFVAARLVSSEHP
jgi:ubiquinone/menaquinone biosynthesis C-methylase UbiE